MMSITNLATASADNVGSFLFEHFFHDRLTPLILVSAAFTTFTFVLVPLLHLGDKPQGQPAGGRGRQLIVIVMRSCRGQRPSDFAVTESARSSAGTLFCH
jgi:hypothetical protein